jgi:hypothetical protein
VTSATAAVSKTAREREKMCIRANFPMGMIFADITRDGLYCDTQPVNPSLTSVAVRRASAGRYF